MEYLCFTPRCEMLHREDIVGVLIEPGRSLHVIAQDEGEPNRLVFIRNSS